MRTDAPATILANQRALLAASARALEHEAHHLKTATTPGRGAAAEVTARLRAFCAAARNHLALEAWGGAEGTVLLPGSRHDRLYELLDVLATDPPPEPGRIRDLVDTWLVAHSGYRFPAP